MPSFSIEAEGETVPLSVQEILRTLSDALGGNNNHQTLKAASQQLINWEKTPGYYSLLQDVYSDFTLDESIRFQAIIQLKNGVDKHWRKTSTNAISKSEKEKIRSLAIEIGIQEQKQALSLQNALLLAKIVRYEFPHDWPDALSLIIQHLRNAAADQSTLYTSNILTIALQIIKELASGRLQRTKKSLESIASELLNVLSKLYINLVQKWASTSQVQDMTNSHSALKTLRRLLIHGFEHPHRELHVTQFWGTLQQHQNQIWSLWTQHTDQVEQHNLLMKHLMQYAKLFLDMARTHAASFVLLGCMDILNRSWTVLSGSDARGGSTDSLEWSVQRSGDAEIEETMIEKLALKALLLFRACIKMVFNPVQTFKYQHPIDKEERKAAVEKIQTSVFSESFVLELMELLVTQYFVLRPRDLKDWEEEPDEWERREEEIADAWEFSLRSCSEKLFLDLIINFKALLVPRLIQVFQQHVKIDNSDVLLKDSLYSALGIAAPCIEDVYDFNSLIETLLIPEVQLEQLHYNLLRRRIAILLAQWVPIKPDTLNRTAIYQIYAFLLTPNPLNDHVVRVTAGRQLRLVLEPFEFKSEELEPFAAPMLENIMNLIVETELSETKMALLETVRTIVMKLESHIQPYASAIMSILPSLWNDSGEEHLMKQAILTMITAIINSLGPLGIDYHTSILPLIHDAVQIESETIVYLLEEALELWSAILQQTPSQKASTELLYLIQDVLPLLDTGSEHLRQCFEIVESYTILSPTTVLDTTFLGPLLLSLKGLLGALSSSRVRDASLAPHVIENLVATVMTPSCLASTGRTEAIELIYQALVKTGYLGEILDILKLAWEYHGDPRPNQKPPDIIGIGETTLFNLLARLALAAPDIFMGSVSAANQSLQWLVTEWLGNFDSIGDAIRKKMQILGVSSLLLASTPPPLPLLESLQSLMTIWTDVVLELADGAADENQGDYLWAGDSPALPDWPGEAPEDTRKRAVANNDPTYVLNIRSFITDVLHSVAESTGGSTQFSETWLSPIDSAVLQAFSDLRLL